MTDRDTQRICVRCHRPIGPSEDAREYFGDRWMHQQYCGPAPETSLSAAEGVRPPATPREVQVAKDAWKTLGRKVHQEVLNRARRGEHHPNLHTASTAYRWACTIIPPDETAGARARVYGGTAVAGAAVEIIIGALIGGGSGGVGTGAAVGGVAAQRRAARKILRLGPPPAL